jgi:hypothetical protein
MLNFQLEVIENKNVIFFPSKFTDPLKSLSQKIHEPQVKNPWSRAFK